MKTVFLILSALAFLLTNVEVEGQSIYRSRTSGNWNSSSTWDYSTNSGTTWLPAVNFPTADSAGSVTIQNTHNVTVPSAVSIPIDQLNLNSGATVTISSNGTLEVKNGSGTDLNAQSTSVLTGAGTLRSNGSGAVMTISGSATISCQFKVSANVTTYDPGFPNVSVFSGSVTIDTGATLFTNPGGYTNRFAGPVTVNGTMATGNNSGFCDFTGSTLVNNGTISAYSVNFSDTVSVSGAGTWSSTNIGVNSGSMFRLAGNVTIGSASNAEMIVRSGARLETNSFILTLDGTSGTKTFTIANNGTAGTSGEINTKGTTTFDIQSGSFFDIRLRVLDGTTNTYCSPFPNVAIYHNDITIESAGTFRTIPGGYNTRMHKTVTNNGTMSTGNSSGNYEFSGGALINNNLINATNVSFSDTTEVSGNGNWSAGNIAINNAAVMKLVSNVNMATSTAMLFDILGGGRLDCNSLTLTLDGSASSKTMRLRDGGATSSLGNINTKGNVTLDLLNGALFSVRLRVQNGVTSIYSSNFPNTGYFYNEIIVDAPGDLRVLAGGYNMIATVNVVNNGIISGGNSSSRFTLSGAAYTNNGNISIYNLSFDGNINHLGNGTYSSVQADITGGSTLNLIDDMRFGLTGTQTFTCQANSTLNPNGKNFKIDGSSANVTLRQIGGSEVADSGSVEFYGNSTLDINTNANFYAPLYVRTGTMNIYNSTFPNTIFLNNSVNTDTGAVMSISAGGYTISHYGILRNNGTIATGNSSGVYVFYGDSLINNGTISAYNFYFESVPASPTTQNCRVSGTGSIVSLNLRINEGTYVQLITNHIMQYLLVNSGATLDITSKTLKFTGAGAPFTINGVLISGGSIIEYGGTAAQSTVHTNTNYANLTINNPAGVTVAQNFSIPGLLRVTSGNLNLNGKVITFLSGASLIENPGSLIFGTSGYITTSRTINAPSNNNVAGFGATVTSGSNLGFTEVRRGHTVQTIPGGQSIKRYYVIRPENNTGLNATCVFKYDESELDGNVEANLKMLKSTNAGATYLTGGGTVNTTQNTVTVTAINDFARHTLGPGTAIATLIFSPEGLYNTATQRLNLRDTVRIELRNMNSPYAIVDSAKSVLDSVTLTAQALFPNAPNGNYYIVVKHRNTIETWSSLPQVYNTEASLLYNFTTAQNQAFGDNMRLKGSRWVFYSGDVNQDGSVDATDVQAIDNDATNFVSGYVPTDLNGDGFVDGSDFTIGDNNAFNFVGVIRP